MCLCACICVCVYHLCVGQSVMCIFWLEVSTRVSVCAVCLRHRVCHPASSVSLCMASQLKLAVSSEIQSERRRCHSPVCLQMSLKRQRTHSWAAARRRDGGGAREPDRRSSQQRMPQPRDHRGPPRPSQPDPSPCERTPRRGFVEMKI